MQVPGLLSAAVACEVMISADLLFSSSWENEHARALLSDAHHAPSRRCRIRHAETPRHASIIQGSPVLPLMLARTGRWNNLAERQGLLPLLGYAGDSGVSKCSMAISKRVFYNMPSPHGHIGRAGKVSMKVAQVGLLFQVTTATDILYSHQWYHWQPKLKQGTGQRVHNAKRKVQQYTN